MKTRLIAALAFILATSLAHAELPKEVVLDMHIRSAASHFKNQQYQQCLDELDKAEQLAGGKLSSDLIFIRAKSNLELNRFEHAKQYATRYIELEGKKGRYYDQALELFISVDERARAHEQQRKDKIANLKMRAKKSDSSYENFRYYTEAAELGEVDSMYQVAESLVHGRGVTKDLAQAVQWYEKAIQGGHKVARIAAGEIYYWGEPGVPRDRKRTFQLFEGLTEEESTVYAAGRYLFGDGVSKDVGKGLALLEQVAVKASYKRGDVSAYIGYLYASGSTLVGGKPDGRQALEWFRKPLVDKDSNNGSYTKYTYPYYVAPYCYETGFCGTPAEPEKAQATYKQVSDNDSLYADTRASAYAGIGRIELQRGSWKEAERALRCAAVSEYWGRCYGYPFTYSKEEMGSTASSAYLHLAMIYATSRDSSQRSGQRAQEALSKARGEPKWFSAMVNAAVLAESGNFEQAVVKQQEAIDLAAAHGIEVEREIWEQYLQNGYNHRVRDTYLLSDEYFMTLMFNRSETTSYSEYWRQYLPEQLASYQQKKPWRYGKQEASSGGFDPFNL